MSGVRVLLVDDDDLMRAGLRSVLSSDETIELVGEASDETIELVGEASDGHAAVERARTLTADVVLMDVRMPGRDGIAATRELLAVQPEARVVILTTFEQDDYIFGALNAGASGFRWDASEAPGTTPGGWRARLGSFVHLTLADLLSCFASFTLEAVEEPSDGWEYPKTIALAFRKP